MNGTRRSIILVRSTFFSFLKCVFYIPAKTYKNDFNMSHTLHEKQTNIKKTSKNEPRFAHKRQRYLYLSWSHSLRSSPVFKPMTNFFQTHHEPLQMLLCPGLNSTNHSSSPVPGDTISNCSFSYESIVSPFFCSSHSSRRSLTISEIVKAASLFFLHGCF